MTRSLDGADAREVLTHGPQRGYAIEVDGEGVPRLRHWSKTSGLSSQPNPHAEGKTIVPRSAFEDGLPPIQRRTARERYRELVNRLLEDMRNVKAVLGKAEVPESIAAQIRHVGWTTGQPDLLDRIERVEPEAVEVYAGFLMRDAAAKQKEADRGKSTLDWHGHDNASIEVQPTAAPTKP